MIFVYKYRSAILRTLIFPTLCPALSLLHLLLLGALLEYPCSLYKSDMCISNFKNGTILPLDLLLFQTSQLVL